MRKRLFYTNVSILTEIHTDSQIPLQVLTPLTVNEINSLTVITKVKSQIIQKLNILTNLTTRIRENMSISTFLKTLILSALKVKINLISGKKHKLNIESPLEPTKYNDRLENQSIYMDDVGDVEDMEIIGDINAIR